MTSEGCGERQRRGVTHVPPDVALPCLTIHISRGGTTNEYRTETAEEYVTPDEGESRLRPSPSRISSVQDLFERCEQKKGIERDDARHLGEDRSRGPVELVQNHTLV